ncbi:serine hydrolase [Chryseobacterium sp. JK1]|uniref:serine hydrolase n=1 Tax=Chryseobacterium sp. JK1 TaxID=874294 RepID=UPI003D692F3A
MRSFLLNIAIGISVILQLISCAKDPKDIINQYQQKKPDDYSILTIGDGGIYSTPEDLFKFDQALRNYTLINRNNTALMYTTAKLLNGRPSNYGFAWFIENNAEEKSVMHTGGLNGFKALFWRDLQHNSCIIVLADKSGGCFSLGELFT